MADVELPARPLLATIPDVELLDVGMNWPLMSDGTEDGTFTPEDLAAAVAAYSDPSVRAPVVKFGHTARLDPLGDGAPVWGRAINLRTTNDGMTLVCDLAGVPAWLADVMASAWPSRSIEGKRNTTSDIGRTHDLVIDAVALLGVQLPAISTLAEVRSVWAARTPDEANVTIKEPTMPTKAKRSAQVTASVTDEDVLRAYYDTVPSGDWSWVRLLQIAPTIVALVDDDNGKLWRIPVTVGADDAISFGTPEEVEAPGVDDYVPAGATTSASRAEAEAIVFASRDESRKGVAGMDAAELRKSLGLAETATDEEVATHLAAAQDAYIAQQAATTDTPPPAPTATTPPATGTPAPPADVDDGEDSTRISKAVLEQLQADAAMGVAAAKRQAKDDEDAFIARHRPRLGPSSNPKAARLEQSWRREYQRNPGEAEALAASHAIVMRTVAAGHEGGGEDFDETKSPWSPQELAAFPELRSQGGN